MKNVFVLLGLLAVVLSGCIGDDIIFDTVPERVSISNSIDSLGLDSTYQFTATYFNSIGRAIDETIIWSTSDPGIIEMSTTGLAKGVAKGSASIKATVNLEGKDPVETEINIVVEEGVSTPVQVSSRSGMLETASSYPLSGNFTLAKGEDDKLTLSFGSDYDADDGLPGLYVYLTNNPNTNVGALEISKVTIFKGAHSYTIPDGVGISDYSHVLYYCKPFGVRVGIGEID